MDKQDEFRRYALDAQKQADQALRPADKAAWLRIAQSWLGLLGITQTPEDQFNSGAKSRGTGQEDSESSH